MMSQTLDDYVLLLDCGVQGLTEVGIVQVATGMERDMNPWKQGATASSPAGESPWELEPWLPMPGEGELAGFALTASKDCPALISWQD